VLGLVGLAGLAACGGSNSDVGSPVTTVVLAPSQMSLATVVAPPAPGLCDPVLVATEVGAATADADVVVTFRNGSAVECEVNLGEPWAREHEIEPDVWLAPGATAELWGECTGTPGDVWELVVNGEPRSIALDAACRPVPVAFFPA